MKILLITPVTTPSRQGNSVTSRRWTRVLRDLGHHVTMAQHYHGESCDVMAALHARRSFPAIERFQHLYPTLSLVVALTRTEPYNDIHTSREAQQSLEFATHLIVLQPKGLDELPSHLHAKTRVIYQSMPASTRRTAKSKTTFDVCVLGHLRLMKDPFRAARSACLLPASSRLRVLHVGKALSDDMAAYARAETAVNRRYRWLGESPRWQALRVLARSHVLVLSSTIEGGANVISEALSIPVPVLASRIAGSIGLLSADYPGYFPVGYTPTLVRLLTEVETSTDFYNKLSTWCQQLAPPSIQLASARHGNSCSRKSRRELCMAYPRT